MTDDQRRAHSQQANSARAYRMILSALDCGHAGRDAVDRIFAEIQDCPKCARAVVGDMAEFGAMRVRNSMAPERWEAWLTDLIATLLDGIST
jgi:ribosomal protein L37AE/L43A